MPRDRFKKLTDREAAFVDLVAQGASYDQAARLAGYSDWRGEAGRLMARQPVRDSIVARLQEHAVKWVSLRDGAKRALMDCLQPYQEVEVPDPDGGFRQVRVAVAPGVRCRAAVAILTILGRRNPLLFADPPESEPESESLDELARRALGSLCKT